jgi:hypothetical protein
MGESLGRTWLQPACVIRRRLYTDMPNFRRFFEKRHTIQCSYFFLNQARDNDPEGVPNFTPRSSPAGKDMYSTKLDFRTEGE